MARRPDNPAPPSEYPPERVKTAGLAAIQAQTKQKSARLFSAGPLFLSKAAAIMGLIFFQNREGARHPWRLRKLDLPSRWDEATFLLLLPETRLYGACRAARKIRRLLEQSPFAFRGRRFAVPAVFAAEEFAGSLEGGLAPDAACPSRPAGEKRRTHTPGPI